MKQTYTVRKPNVGDLRATMTVDNESERSFLLAERCILVNGEPIGRTRLDEMDADTFSKLMEQLNAPKKP